MIIEELYFFFFSLYFPIFAICSPKIHSCTVHLTGDSSKTSGE